MAIDFTRDIKSKTEYFSFDEQNVLDNMFTRSDMMQILAPGRLVRRRNIDINRYKDRPADEFINICKTSLMSDVIDDYSRYRNKDSSFDILKLRADTGRLGLVFEAQNDYINEQTDGREVKDRITDVMNYPDFTVTDIVDDKFRQMKGRKIVDSEQAFRQDMSNMLDDKFENKSYADYMFITAGTLDYIDNDMHVDKDSIARYNADISHQTVEKTDRTTDRYGDVNIRMQVQVNDDQMSY